MKKNIFYIITVINTQFNNALEICRVYCILIIPLINIQKNYQL